MFILPKTLKFLDFSYVHLDNVYLSNVTSSSTIVKRMIVIMWYHTGMAGKDDLADAVLGGASDYVSDIFAKIVQWYVAKDDEKVLCV